MAAKVLSRILADGHSLSDAVRWMEWSNVAVMELEVAKSEITRRGRR